MAEAAAGLRCLVADGAPPVRAVDACRVVAPAAPGGTGPARRGRHARLVPDSGGCRLPPGEKRGDHTGPNPVDRGKSGSKLHLLTDAHGLPLAVALSAANTHDSNALIPLVKAIPDVTSRRGPRRRKPAKLHADKGYDYDHLRRWLRERGITPKIARKGIESSQRLGRHRWVVERSFAWLGNYRRLTTRWERKASHFLGFLTLAATLTCHKHHLRQAI